MNPQEMMKRAGGMGRIARQILLFGAFLVVIVFVLVLWESASKGKSLSLFAVNETSDGYVVMQNGRAADMAYGEMGAPTLTSSKSIRMPIMPSPIPASTNTTAGMERKVIRNASLDILVLKADEAVSAIGGIASSYQGFVDGSNLYEIQDGVQAGTMTIRVPSVSFESAIAAIKELAVKVNREQSNASDVTAQFVDLEAQVKNYKAEEAQYQEIMKRAVKIEDVLNVASRLADVRGRIESVQGQINYLSRQVEMSTITISLKGESNIAVGGVIWRPLEVAKKAVQDLLEGLASFVDFLIRLVIYLPVLALKIAFIAIVVALIWKAGKKLYRRLFVTKI